MTAVVAALWLFGLMFFTPFVVLVATFGGLALLLVAAIVLWPPWEVAWPAAVDALLGLVAVLAGVMVVAVTILFLVASLIEGIPRVWEKMGG